MCSKMKQNPPIGIGGFLIFSTRIIKLKIIMVPFRAAGAGLPELPDQFVVDFPRESLKPLRTRTD